MRKATGILLILAGLVVGVLGSGLLFFAGAPLPIEDYAKEAPPWKQKP